MWWTKPKISQKQKILNLLKNSKDGATSRQMWELGIFKYSCRISDLRKEGYNIKCLRIKGTLFRYYLINPRTASSTKLADYKVNFVNTK